MKLAVTFTVNNRPHYLKEVLESWSKVRGKEDFKFFFNVEETSAKQDNLDLLLNFFGANKDVHGKVFNNNGQLGVLENPYQALDRVFKLGAEYVLLAEDDLTVSDDILEYHKWTSKEYKDVQDIAIVCSFASIHASQALENAVCRVKNFASVLGWATWRDRWVDYLEPTWDHDYSTGVGEECGWDWNINLRVLPPRNKYSIQPLMSRIQNIGAVGVHSPEGNWYITAPEFKEHKEVQPYHELKFHTA